MSTAPENEVDDADDQPDVSWQDRITAYIDGLPDEPE